MPYAKKRESIFGSILTPINTNISNNSNKRKKVLFSNNYHDFISAEKCVKSNNEINIENSIESTNSVCCKKKCISNLTNSEKSEVLRYFNSIKSVNQQNEYLKACINPNCLNQTKGKTNGNFEYTIRINNNEHQFNVIRKVCTQAFLKLHEIKYSRLRTKILKNRDQSEDMRGIHNSHINKIPLEVELDIREFIENYESRESHYSPSVATGRKYIESDKNISMLYREFIEKYTEYDGFVNYQFFYYIFKDSNIGFGFPRSDLCNTCEELNVKLKSISIQNNNVLEIQLKDELNKHQIEANIFYKLQKDMKSLAKSDKTLTVISMDYEKNFFVPITKVNIEYYSRQLSIHNFGIHNMSSEKATMFMYSENYAMKGPNETISFLNYYIKNKIDKKVKKLYIFSDNCFAQMKCRYLWLYYDILVKSDIYEEINLIYPIVGHSYLDCDRDFGLIEKSRKCVHKVNLPSEWVQLVRNANKKNPFEVIYVNHPLTDNLVNDSTELCFVSDYKKYFEFFLKSKLSHLTDVRRMKFTKNDIKVSLNLGIEPEISIDLLNSNEKIDFNLLNSKLNLAYSDFIPINKAKYDDIKKLLNYVILPENATFYDDKNLKFIESKTSNIINNLELNTELDFCKCKGKCVQKCLCKIKNRVCNNSCLCKKNLCKNNVCK
jgi:hypothetical protein